MEAKSSKPAPGKPGPKPTSERLLNDAIEKVRTALDKQDEPTKEMVANLILLIKLKTEMADTNEKVIASEVKVIWQDPWDESSES